MKGSHNHEVLGAQNVMQRWEMTYMNSSTYIWNILILKSPEEFEMGFKSIGLHSSQFHVGYHIRSFKVDLGAPLWICI